MDLLIHIFIWVISVDPETSQYLGGKIEIDNNALTTLSGLEGLTEISGTLQIRYNDVLSSLSGLVNLSSVGGNLWILDNAVVSIYSNSGNCQHSAMILALCSSNVTENSTGLLPLTMYPILQKYVQ